MRCAVAVSLLLAAAVARADDDEYVVREGDTCLEIVRVLFPGDKQGLAYLHELNPQLGPLPHTLVPGTRLRTGRGGDARLTFVRPRVTSRRHGDAEESWRPAATGQDLFRLDEVLTLPEATAEITFRDATHLQMEGDALVVIYGAAARVAELHRSGTVELTHGDLRLHLAELRGEVPARRDMVVTTPAASVTTDARDVHIGVDAEKMSRVSVHRGHADVEAQQQTVKLVEGFGTRVAAGNAPEPARKLPSAPRWSVAGARELSVATAGTASVMLAWQPVDGALRYRAVLARDASFNDPLFAAWATEPRAELFAVPPGRYHARVVPVDASGLIGEASAPRVVDVMAVAVERGGATAGTLRGSGELMVSFPGLASAEVALDGKPVGWPLVVRDVGRHELRVQAVGAGAPLVLACEVVAPRAEVVRAGREDEAEIRLLDERGALLAIDAGADLGVRGTRVGSPRRVRDGVYRVALHGARELVVLWEGRPIGELR